jgi:NAD-dependent dihydropyrimidine dehydrogenase PreA subunit
MARGGGRSGEPLNKKRRAAAHPDRPGKRRSAPPGSFAPVIDHARCEGKRDCIDVCPNDVFQVRRIDDADYRPLGPLNRLKVRAHGMMTAYTPNADDCRACGLCVVACPEQAIMLTGLR